MTLVIYAGRHGTTKRYAEWIAGAVGAELLPLRDVRPAMLENYDTVVFGAAVYSGRITGVEFIKAYLETLKKHGLILFTVGLTMPGDDASFQSMLSRNLTREEMEGVSAYYFLGAIYYKELKQAERIKMWILKTSLKNKTARSRVESDILESYNGKLDYSNRKYIRPLVDELRRREAAGP